MSLMRLVVRGVFWNGIAQVLAQGLQFIVLAILARLLFPEDFGVLGMAMVFIGLVITVNELGLGAAIIQRKHIEDKHLSTSFGISLAAGAVLCIIAIVVSPFIAGFYNTELVKPIICILSIGFIFGPLGAIHRSLLEKQLDFKSIAISEAGAAILSGAVSVSLAFTGFGVWSLVIGQLVGSLLRAVLLWVRCRWRPSLSFSFSHFKELFGFGANVMGSNSLNYVQQNADYLIVGRFLGASALGFYTLAYQLATFPLTRLSWLVTRVTFPAFSVIQDDNIALRQGYLKVIKYISLVTFPLLAGLLVVAPEFVPVVFGAKWMPMILPLQILCLAGVLRSVFTTVGSILLSKRRADIVFKWSILMAIGMPIAVLVGVRYGMVGVAVAVTVWHYLAWPIIQKITNRLIDLSFYNYFKALFPAITSSIIMVASVWLFQRLSLLISLQAIISLVISIIVGAIVYMLAVRMIDKNSLKEIRLLIEGLRGKAQI